MVETLHERKRWFRKIDCKGSDYFRISQTISNLFCTFAPKNKKIYGNKDRRIYAERPDGEYVSAGHEARVRLYRAFQRGQVESDQYADQPQEAG